MGRSMLHEIYLFKGLTESEMASLSELAETQTYNTGDTIFIKGEPARAMYFIKHGSVKIQQTTKSGDSIVVATLGTGSHFGEMAFVDNEPRSASAAASEMTEVVSVSYEKLMSLLIKQPTIAVKFYRELTHFLCGRLRATTNDLGFAREKNLSHF